MRGFNDNVHLIFLIHPLAEESQSIWSFIPESMHHTRVAVATSGALSEERAAFEELPGGPVNRNQVHTSPYCQSTARSDMKLWP